MIFNKKHIIPKAWLLKVFMFCLILCFNINSLAQKKIFSCINEDGEVLFNFESYYVSLYSEGLAVFKTKIEENGRKYWRAGFINEKGEVILPPVYDSRNVSKYGFKNGVSWVRMPNERKYFLINKKGNTVSAKQYDNVGCFSEGLCDVYENGKMGFIDNAGQEVIPCKYSGDSQFTEGLVLVRYFEDENGKYGFINKSGETVIPFVFNKTGNHRFCNGKCVVNKNDTVYIINNTGDIICSPKNIADNTYYSYREWAISCTGEEKKKYGFLDKDNEWAIAPVYDTVLTFIEDRLIVAKNGKYGVIDTKNNIIIPFDFDKIDIHCNRNGLFLCCKGSSKLYYNRKGSEININNIQKLGTIGEGKYFTYRDVYNKWGYADQDGIIHIPAQYDFATPFSEGKAWIY